MSNIFRAVFMFVLAGMPLAALAACCTDVKTTDDSSRSWERDITYDTPRYESARYERVEASYVEPSYRCDKCTWSQTDEPQQYDAGMTVEQHRMFGQTYSGGRGGLQNLGDRPDCYRGKKCAIER